MKLTSLIIFLLTHRASGGHIGSKGTGIKDEWQTPSSVSIKDEKKHLRDGLKNKEKDCAMHLVEIRRFCLYDDDSNGKFSFKINGGDRYPRKHSYEIYDQGSCTDIVDGPSEVIKGVDVLVELKEHDCLSNPNEISLGKVKISRSCDSYTTEVQTDHGNIIYLRVTPAVTN